MASTKGRVLILVTVTVGVAVVASLSAWVTGRALNTDDIVTSAPVRFDPGQQIMRLGYLPGPVETAEYTTGPEFHRLDIHGSFDDAPSTEEEDASSFDPDWSIELRMAARGVDIRSVVPYDEDSGEVPVRGERLQVHGRPAFQATFDFSRVLTWEYAPDAWMHMMLYAKSAEDRRDEIARRVAEGVRLEATPRVLPIRVKGLPDGAVLEKTWLYWKADGHISYSADYLVGRVEEDRPNSRPVVRVGVSTEKLARARHLDRVTVAGRSATVSESRRKAGTMGIYRVAQLPGRCADCVAEVWIEPYASAVMGDRDDALKLAASIRLVEGHEDPARWRFW
ncbi:hypothetical protein [Verrucosispora sp. NA02020]|uniref:hypothetical protein n=1 Tax=Verrucosispora sp. NA02020 TaxID=2742132 RepID=UPI0015918919|nr:hypothetical protein [Verrucosispora sp. NA02020]QKW14846.1 hypothetical protein HUT12_20065 [Verrucosispora sp. NA02020]